MTEPGELLALMTDVMDGTLDAHGRDDLTLMTPREAAAKHYDEELAQYTSPRDWWRIAELPGGEPAGFVIPAHNGYSAIIAYLGVVPAHRGHGYIADILAEGTRVLAAQNVPFIRASTDLGNVPMAAAFHRAGWVTTGHQIDMTWERPADSARQRVSTRIRPLSVSAMTRLPAPSSATPVGCARSVRVPVPPLPLYPAVLSPATV